MSLLLRIGLLCVAILSTGCMADGHEKSFPSYWSEFRVAVLENDYKKLENLTRFPLEVKGVDDSIPVVHYKQDEFKEVFEKIIKQTIYQPHNGEYIETDMRTVVNKTDVVPDIQKDQEYQLEQLVFENIDGRWYLTRAYLEE